MKVTLKAYELNAMGLTHKQIIDVIAMEYGVVLIPTDITTIIDYHDLASGISASLCKSEVIPLSAYKG